MKTDSIIADKAYLFAIEIVKIYKNLTGFKKEYVLSKQLLRSGTSIGANINEAVGAQSKRDFVHKLSIALKEARETLYWLRLLKDTEFIEQTDFENLYNNCNELIKILSSVILTVKQKYFNTNVQSTHNS